MKRNKALLILALSLIFAAFLEVSANLYILRNFGKLGI